MEVGSPSKPCSKCKIEKPLTDFGSGHCRDGKNSWCQACCTAASNLRRSFLRATDPAYREALAEQKRKARRAADPTLIARDALRADASAHVSAFQHHLYRIGGRRANAHVLAWQEHQQAQRAAQPLPNTTPEQRVYERAKTAWRRARRLGRLASWATLKSTLSAYRYADHLERLTGIDWHVDHSIPLRAEFASGLHCCANLQVLPRSINEAKSNALTSDLLGRVPEDY